MARLLGGGGYETEVSGAEGIPRGARADAENAREILLAKKVSTLRATYQVRLLTYLAQRRGKRLVLLVPRGFSPEPSLRALITKTGAVIGIEEDPQ